MLSLNILGIHLQLIETSSTRNKSKHAWPLLHALNLIGL